MSIVREAVDLLESTHANPINRLKALRRYWILNVKDFSPKDQGIVVTAVISTREEVNELFKQEA